MSGLCALIPYLAAVGFIATIATWVYFAFIWGDG